MYYLLCSILLFVSFFVDAAASSRPQKIDSQPNIILFYVDDLGWADTSVLMMNSDPESRSDFNQTPALESLANRGMKFSNAYAPAPTCTPSRKSIQLGKTPGRIQYTFVNDVLALKRNLKWGGHTSLADVVKGGSTNYITAHFGKGMENEFMKVLGYDVTDEYDIGPNGNFHGEYNSIPDRKSLPDDDPKRIYSLTKSSTDFIKEYAGKRPFFMMVSHYAVHVPHAASSHLIDKYRKLPRGKYCTDDDYLTPEEMNNGRKITSWRLQYAAMLEEVDMSLGAILETLKKHNIDDNTYVIVTSDNGGGMNPNGPLRGCKANLYEGGLRVPFVVAGPNIPQGVQCDIPVVQWDLLPTFHDLVENNNPLPSDLDGGSLRSVFENGDEGNVKRTEKGFVFHYPCYFAPPLSVIREGDYKLMRHINTGEIRLFDLKNDYAEKYDISKNNPNKVNELINILDKYLEKIDAENLDEVYEARFWQLDKFEAQAKEQFERKTKGLDAIEHADRIASFKEKLDSDINRFNRNREEVRLNIEKTDW